MLRSLLCFALVSAALVAGGCGARTGLKLPDASLDGGVDLGRDAARDLGVDMAVDADIPCIDIPADGGPVTLDVALVTHLQRADVVFLIDVTASMTLEIDQIRMRLRDTIAPTLQAQIPDVTFGVATFADYPVSPYGAAEDHLFQLVQPITADLATVQGALDHDVVLGNGADEPEGQVEALYEIATGSGISGVHPTTGALTQWVPASFGCPHGGFGYPCFRDDSLPLVFMFTDAHFHEDIHDTNPYTLAGTRVHRYVDARDALRAAGIRVIGFWSGSPEPSSSDDADLVQAVSDSGATDTRGAPLVFDIGMDGQNLDTRAVEAIQAFAAGVALDIDAVAFDPVPDDGFDATTLVRGIVPLRAEPTTGIDSIDFAMNTFRGVKAGTRVFFDVHLANDVVMPGDAPQEFLLDIVFRGNGRPNLGRTRIRVVIPARDGTGCPR